MSADLASVVEGGVDIDYAADVREHCNNRKLAMSDDCPYTREATGVQGDHLGKAGAAQWKEAHRISRGASYLG